MSRKYANILNLIRSTCSKTFLTGEEKGERGEMLKNSCNIRQVSRLIGNRSKYHEWMSSNVQLCERLRALIVQQRFSKCNY